jgi:hypothetical protein
VSTRRAFIALLGGAAAWPLAAGAQQPIMPVIGFVSSLAHRDLGLVVPGFHEGLNAAGFIEGCNIAIEYRCSNLGNIRSRADYRNRRRCRLRRPAI